MIKVVAVWMKTADYAILGVKLDAVKVKRRLAGNCIVYSDICTSLEDLSSLEIALFCQKPPAKVFEGMVLAIFNEVRYS